MLPIAGQTAGPIGLAGGVIGFKKIKKKNFLKFFKILFFNIFFQIFFHGQRRVLQLYILKIFLSVFKRIILFSKGLSTTDENNV